MIRVVMEQFGEVGEYRVLLANALKGAGIQHKLVAERIANSIPPADLVELVRQRDALRIANQAKINKHYP